ncbi:hypothetical protein [Pedobacter westerhofensis]|nr:hypothetical protein [Pedobacter westerhofensis]
MVYKLCIAGQKEIQGLVSATDFDDHVYLNLVESSPINYGANKLYEGVAGNLIAFCCKLSFDNGNDGIIGFKAKSNLVQHYVSKLGATHIGAQNMIIYPEKALYLINRYFKQL